MKISIPKLSSTIKTILYILFVILWYAVGLIMGYRICENNFKKELREPRIGEKYVIVDNTNPFNVDTVTIVVCEKKHNHKGDLYIGYKFIRDDSVSNRMWSIDYESFKKMYKRK